MIVIDVPLPTLFNIVKGNQSMLFYVDKGRYIHIYTALGNGLYRNVRKKKDSPTEEALWIENNLSQAIRADKVSNFNEEKLVLSLDIIFKELESIKRRLKQ